MLQFRPSKPGNRTDPLYCPQRDVAYLGPYLICLSIDYALESAEKEEWYKQFLNHYGLSKQVLEPVAPAVASLLSTIHYDFKDALRLSGFDKLPVATQVAFYTKMGQALLAAIHHGLREITDISETEPRTIKRLVKKISETMEKHRLP